MEVKKMGQVFTPQKIVNDILDAAEYKGEVILGKHVIDNSCGDGAFLIAFVQRYVRAYQKVHHSLDGVEDDLETYIHGIEMDSEIYQDCLMNLNEFAKRKNFREIHWDILNEDALMVSCYDKGMDYVIGNPPYVRTHNLESQYDQVRKFDFSASGMADLFLVFFELGFQMLKEDGILCYITPNSFYNSVAGAKFREVIQEKKHLEVIMDLGHYQPFEVSTYTTITKFHQGRTYANCRYYQYDLGTGKPKFVTRLLYSDLFVDGKIVLSKDIGRFRPILNFVPIKEKVQVKNGFATLKDDIFIQEEFPFDGNVIDVVKASTGQWKKCIYPYDEEGCLLPFEELSMEVQEYLKSRDRELLARSIEKKGEWYAFGRSQAIKDVSLKKISINTTILDVESIKLEVVPEGSGVYSGLYLLTDVSFEKIQETLCCEDFIEYLKILNKCKSGGYYTFSSRDLYKYLNYQLRDFMGNEKFLDVVKDSYNTYLATHPRSNEKLKVLHGAIAFDLQRRLGSEYVVHSLGFQDGKEAKITGKYMDKNVDIAVVRDGEYLAAFGVKFIMSNYSQNSNNYFENMLGETINLQLKGIPYYQIVLFPSVVPYFKDGGKISSYERVTAHNLHKYLELSKERYEDWVHVPKKMLLCLVDFPKLPDIGVLKNKKGLVHYYEQHPDYQIFLSKEEYEFGEIIMYNHYSRFIEWAVEDILKTE